MSDYPWSVLVLDGPASEREIRSAYARRLRAVRPESDPEGFQQLVEARNFAIELAHDAAAEQLTVPAPLGVETERSEPMVGAIASSSALTAASAMPVSTEIRAATATGDGEIEPAMAQRSAAELVTGELAASTAGPNASTSPVQPIATGEAEPLPTAPAANPEAIGEPWLRSPEDILQRLKLLLAANNQRRDAAETARVLADLGRLPRSVRLMLEPDILTAIARSATTVTTPRWPRLAALLERLPGAVRAGANERREADSVRRALLVALDEEYGWTTSDRAVHRALDDQPARRLLTDVRTGQREARIVRDGLPPRWDGDGLPLLDTADLHAFFGSELTHYSSRYQEARSLRHWHANWRWTLLLLCPMWAIGLRQWRVIGVWLVGLFGGGFLFNLIDSWAKAASLAQGPVSPGLIGFMPLAGLHLYVARNHHRLEIERLARAAARADRKGLLDPRERARYLESYAPAFRYQNERRSGWRIGNWQPSWWFWIIIFYAIVRLLAALGGR